MEKKVDNCLKNDIELTRGKKDNSDFSWIHTVIERGVLKNRKGWRWSEYKTDGDYKEERWPSWDIAGPAGRSGLHNRRKAM